MMVGGCEWEEIKVDRPGRLLLRCHALQDSIVVNFGKSDGGGGCERGSSSKSLSLMLRVHAYNMAIATQGLDLLGPRSSSSYPNKIK